MATEDEEDGPFPGPSLRPDGQITGRTPAASAAGELEGRLAAVELPRAPSLELELVARGPKKYEPPPSTYREAPPPPRRTAGIKVALAALVLGVGLFAAFLFAPRSWLARLGLERFDVSTLSFRSGHAPLLVDSEPGNATVLIAGKVVGGTPWAGDNIWPDGAPITITLPGYVPWTGTLRAGVEKRLSVTLKPRGKAGGGIDHVEGDAP